MSGAEGLAALILPPKVRKCVDSHLASMLRAEDGRAVIVWLNRTQSLIEGLEATGALNDATIEALYVNFDDAATDRLKALKA